MSGRTRSTPRCSSRGKADPASTTTMSSAVLVDGHVLADLAEAAERNDAKGSRAGSVCAALDRGGLEQAEALKAAAHLRDLVLVGHLDERQPQAPDLVPEQVERGT